LQILASESLNPPAWRAIATKVGSSPWTGDAVIVESPNPDGTVSVFVAEPNAVDCDACFFQLAGSLR
jgi:hypothetical protein